MALVGLSNGSLYTGWARPLRAGHSIVAPGELVRVLRERIGVRLVA